MSDSDNTTKPFTPPDLAPTIGVTGEPFDPDATVVPGANIAPERAVVTEPAAVRVESSAFWQTPGESGNALPIGTRLGEFEITGLVGEGGFGIVYRAFDHSLERQVALKEYLPASLATRRSDTTVRVKSVQLAEPFNAGLRSFVNEARLLAQFDHPALLKVFRFWEARGTAYMVMPFYEGITLKQALRTRASPPDEGWLRRLLEPLLEALEVVHRANCFHRDIAPDNILLLADDRPVLLDFGAARRVIGDMTQALTVILKPGYAPIEQYDEIAHLRQGAWTDLYALGAVVHYCITGKPPPAAVGRSLKDSYRPLREAAAGRYSARFLSAIDRSLAPMPDQRPQTIAAFRDDLGIRQSIARKPGSGEVRPPAEQADRNRTRWPAVSGVLFGIAIAAFAGYLLTGNRQDTTPQRPTVAPTPASLRESDASPKPQPPFEPVPQVTGVPREHKPLPDLPKAQPGAETGAPPLIVESTKPPPRERTEPRMPPVTAAVPGRKPASPPSTAERPPAKSGLESSERCVGLINRAQLGEPISAADLDYIKKECR